MSMSLQSLDRDTSDATVFVQGAQGANYLYARIMTDIINAPGSEPSPAGRVYLLSLPAGEYTVSNITGSWSRHSNSMLGFDTSEYFNVPVQQKFSVRAGEVSYLGSLNLNINFQSSVTFSNEFKRDMFDLQKRYQLTDTSNIQQQLLGSQ
ncbi:hypothetical protein HQ393_17345 (plasmid) [Chitinibacter bivalviorum]|nr:hypothetical protein [Chitinibacter bivalviorum]QLG90081.1 hypothetical protein HQ393_17345 [Chitinibacter bivalviorum]